MARVASKKAAKPAKKAAKQKPSSGKAPNGQTLEAKVEQTHFTEKAGDYKPINIVYPRSTSKYKKKDIYLQRQAGKTEKTTRGPYYHGYLPKTGEKYDQYDKAA